MSRTLPALLAVLLAAGCSRPAPAPELPPVAVTPGPERKSPAESLEKGIAYLLKQQSEDGAWRSDVSATFKDGTALTPLALCALLDVANSGLHPPESAAARKKAVAWLAKLVKPDGTIDPGPDGLDYPLYTAALCVKALSHPENGEHRKARDAWVKYLLDRQLTEKLGWKPEDKEYGGWGYCRVIPRKPKPGEFAPPLVESNLSATVFALDALKAAVSLDEETAKAADVFIRRCQNEDGGFHFIYDDPVRNKAGSPDPPGTAGARFHSYGSTTADGLRALILCGSPVDSEWRVRARLWLTKNFRADTHPGVYVKAHESNREAVYYYYAASVSKTLRELKMTEAGGVNWAAELAAELAKRQREDGSWANPVELVRENDPIVATCNAVSALARCRK
jgi:squalene-hopene/tetraprenyl-beta-curcumene cyclase